MESESRTGQDGVGQVRTVVKADSERAACRQWVMHLQEAGCMRRCLCVSDPLPLGCPITAAGHSHVAHQDAQNVWPHILAHQQVQGHKGKGQVPALQLHNAKQRYLRRAWEAGGHGDGRHTSKNGDEQGKDGDSACTGQSIDG